MLWLPSDRPARPALSAAGVTHDYAALADRVDRLARLLRALGLGAGSRIAILAANHVAHFELMLAAPRLGIVIAPLNTRLTAAELAPMLARLAPALVLVDAEHAALLAGSGLPTLTLDDHEARLAAAPPGPLPPRMPLPDDPHLILHTGGTTGIPKGAVLPYRQTLGNALDTLVAWDLHDDDCAIQSTACFHAAVNVLGLPLLRTGGHVVLMSRFDAGEYLMLASRHRATLLFMVPTMYASLAAEPGFAAWDARRIRWAVTGGAPCPPPLAAAYAAKGIVFRVGFGMTEAGVNCFTQVPGQPADSVGVPMPNLTMRILDEQGRPVADGEVGELWLSGPQVFSGYLGDAPRAVGDWFATGDLASRDARGLWRIRGRRKDLYISGGEKVFPVEVEAVLSQLPGVGTACVFGVPHPHWGETGIALVVPAPGAEPDPQALRQQLRSRLAGYKLPARIELVPALPISPAGKILRDAARRDWAARQPLGEGLPA